MTTTTAAVDHGITITEVHQAALRAECLCGWVSPIVGSRAAAAEVGAVHIAGLRNALHSLITRGSHCACGRPARQALDGGQFGPTGYCGAPAQPLDPCDCGHGAEQHDRSVCHVYGLGMAQLFNALNNPEAQLRNGVTQFDSDALLTLEQVFHRTR